MAEELDVLRAAIVHELELARDGDGYEADGVAEEIVRFYAGPVLAAARKERDAERASRRAWAEEAMRRDMAEEARYCTGAHDCTANVHIEGCFYSETDSPQHPQYVLPCGHTNAEAQRSIQHELCGPAVLPYGGEQ
jgi:hypothetical protein